jgi:hypothetical protein
LAVLLQSSQDDPNPAVHIPDHNLLTVLIEKGVDTDGNGKISALEAEAVTFLNVSGKSIADMAGIESFADLEILDISGCTALTFLDCYLSIENMPSLEKVCVWTTPFPPEDLRLCNEGSTSVNFTSDCNENIPPN